MKRGDLVINGNRYLKAAELVKALGISRQTLWRWRQDGRIPQGSKYQDRMLVFTETEAALIREFAERIVPAGTAPSVPPARSRT